MTPRALSILPAITLGVLAFAQEPRTSPARVDFARDVKPILDGRCIECHGPAKKKGGLRLDQRASALRRVVPHKSGDSELFQRVTSTDEDERMPQSGDALSAREIEVLRAWIDEGAVWPDGLDSAESGAKHWAYVKPVLPAVPKPKSAAGMRNAIDAFVRARLDKEGLAPSSEADKVTLIRRVTLDLTGLPPTPAEVDAFVADASSDAYEKLVDRLLASPRYGERMAQWWLDLARFADTNGYEKDARRTAWPWRDWVIDAFNANMRFDAFTIRQIAGDLLPDAKLADRIATGFQRNTLVNEEGGTDPDEFRNAAVVDRANTTSTLWLGSTIGCAQCHDHKFDPFSQREYYQLFAFFDNTTDTGNKIEPVLRTPTAEQQKTEADLRARIEATTEKLESDDPRLDAEESAWSTAVSAALPPEPSWSVLTPTRASALNGTQLEVKQTGAVLAKGPAPERETYTIECTIAAGQWRALRLEALSDLSLPTFGPGRAPNGNFVLTDFTLELEKNGAFERVEFGASDADFEQTAGRFRVAYAVDSDPSSGWAIRGDEGVTDSHRAIFLPELPIKLESPARARITLAFQSPYVEHSLGCFRLSIGDDDELVRWISPPRFEAWRSVGPFGAKSQMDGFTTAYPPEPELIANGKLSPAYVPLAEGWVPRREWRDGNVNALEGTNSVYYLQRRVTCDEITVLRLHIGADDAFRLWLNGAPVIVAAQMKGDAVDQHELEITLARGDNHLALKVINGGGPGAFFFQTDRRTRDRMPEDVIGALRKKPEERNDEERARIRRYWRSTASPECKALVDETARNQAALDRLLEQIATTPVLEERKDRRQTHVLVKGNYRVLGDEVVPEVPAVLGALDDDTPRDRLGFARWLVSAENPLTARVIANRMWERLFGRGIVATADDFGTRGDVPSHPELLDWLALELRGNGWDLKRFLKTIVTSATYRQSSNVTRALHERDPDNVLLARAPRPRLEIETLRDQALYVSGLLSEKIGGPSVMPPQPDGIWAPVYSDDKWMTAKDAERYRRGLYVFWRRSSPYATYMLFDAPSRELACTRRARTNTPLQALALLNDPAFVECARALAQRTLTEGGADDRARIEHMFRLCTARKPDADEIGVLEKLLIDERKRLATAPASDGADPVEARAWSAVANVVLNLDETVTRN